MPPLTVVVAAVVVWVPSVMVTEIASPLLPVPLAVRLLTLALVMIVGVVVKATVGRDGNLGLGLGDSGDVADWSVSVAE